jgi:ribosomal protein S18 acetylase RimI-like enzyme
MESSSEVVIDLAHTRDASAILALQRAAYQSEAEKYGDLLIPPLVQTESELADEIRTVLVLKAVSGRRIVGSVRGSKHGTTVSIGRLIVQPDLQGRGVGTKLMAAIEASFPNTDRFELFTGHLSEDNLRLYRHLGYEEFKRQPVSDKLTLVFMQKRNLPQE